MDTEKERILKMLEEGKINSEEAYRLLESLGKPKEELGGRMFRVIVESEGDEKVNISIPLGVATKLLKIGGSIGLKFSPEVREKMEEYNIDIDEIIRTIDEELGGEPFTLVKVEDGEERVKVWIE
ncbi:hypothetical protein KAW18_05300 [candidate division WOR-3 bacterium]|nr:hypothetical protein [candidate division WOR-3 bacterium]MCK4526768.1 hypothetical protein [candidate division WOR-3 bacterium]